MDVKDPVCGMTVDSKVSAKKGLVISKDNKKYYFCSDKCKNAFSKKNSKGNVPFYESESFGKYFPIFLGLVLIVGSIYSILNNVMPIYMGIFLIIFSLAKLIDLKGFANAFSKYDVVAKRFSFYGYLYPFIELILGIMLLLNLYMVETSYVIVVVFSFGLIGVTKNVFAKKMVQCACLGTKIKVPLTKVTLLENIIMIIMGVMIAFGYSIMI